MPTALHEREDELAALDRALALTRAGTGSCLVVEGPAGIGKTRLLTAARDQAREAGLRTLRARASDLEQTAAFGLVHQLLDHTVHGADAARRAAWFEGAAGLAGPVFDVGGAEIVPAASDLYPTLHGLYWLLVALTREAPLVVVCDDLQWADEPSLALLGFLARRVEEIPLLLITATRPVIQAGRPALAALTADPEVTVLRPGSLSRDAIAAWTRASLGAEPHPAFVATCEQASGGNPLLVGELLRDVAAHRWDPTADTARRVIDLAPDGVASAVLLRLAGLSTDARRLAIAVAVLGDETPPAQASALAGIDLTAAGAAATALVAAGVLADGTDALSFTHPLLRSAVYGSLTAVDRADAHSRAAALLRAGGARGTTLAGHLLKTAPADDPGVVALLREAAAAALEVGDAAGAATLLRRALEEPPAAGDRRPLLVELGEAAWRAGEPAGLDHVRAAIDESADADERARHVLALSRMAKWTSPAIVVEALDAQLALPGTSAALVTLLEAELVGCSSLGLRVRMLARRRMATLPEPAGAPAAFADAMLMAGAAFYRGAAGEDAPATIDLARRALASGLLSADPTAGGHALTAIAALAFAGAPTEALQALDRGLAQSRAGGSPVGVVQPLSVRSWVLFLLGRVREAETDAEEALALAAEIGQDAGLIVMAYAVAGLSAVERGAAPEELHGHAQRLADPARDDDALPYDVLLHALGRVRAAAGDADGAAAAYRACGDRGARWGATGPSVAPWRPDLARLLAAGGRADEALALADEQLALATAFGAYGAQGAALRERALIGPAAERLAGLERAAELLASTPEALQHALALVELGGERRRRGAKAEARAPLAEGLELADRLGAVALAGRAREELLASGARPRRVALRGIDALTPSERRVAALAADGLTNRMIAQQLFVTDKTVEGHLANAYDKLGVRSRRELPQAMAA